MKNACHSVQLSMKTACMLPSDQLSTAEQGFKMKCIFGCSCIQVSAELIHHRNVLPSCCCCRAIVRICPWDEFNSSQ